MAAMVSRQTSASDLHLQYTTPPSPKSLTFTKSHTPRRPSLTSWLGRGSSQPPASPITKIIHISDPQPTNPYDAAAKVPGALGKGATVIRTPHQALTAFPPAETPNEKDELESLPVVEIKSPRPAPRPEVPQIQPLVPRRESPAPRRVESPVSRQGSPAHSRAPSIPSNMRSLQTSKSYSHLQNSPRKNTSSLPTRHAPLPLNLVSSSRQPLLRSALKPPSPTKPNAIPILPPLPPPTRSNSKESLSPMLPPFHPVLLSGVPSHPVPPSQIIVTLETSTLSQRTTVATLTSRPSRLTSYLQALVPSTNKDSSAESNFSSLFAAHLAQAGIVPHAQTSHSGPIHIFLDRPSGPYAHILTYLRAGSNLPGVLPRAASLALSTEPARVEALCELRDEAKYLELSELVELCDKELRARAPKLRSTPSSNSLREFKFGSGSEGSGARVVSSASGEALEARLREYKFGMSRVESLREVEGEGEEGDDEVLVNQVSAIAYEKRGSHAGTVITVPPKMQLPGTRVGHLRQTQGSPRVRTLSDVHYTQVQQPKTWI